MRYMFLFFFALIIALLANGHGNYMGHDFFFLPTVPNRMPPGQWGLIISEKSSLYYLLLLKPVSDRQGRRPIYGTASGFCFSLKNTRNDISTTVSRLPPPMAKTLNSTNYSLGFPSFCNSLFLCTP